MDDVAGQQAAVNKAEELFRFVAQTYLEADRDSGTVSGPPTAPPSPEKPATRAPSFLSSACSFQIPITAMQPSRSPLEELRMEIDNYFAFQGESAPRDEKEREARLMDPLGSWKVCSILSAKSDVADSE